jgi:N-acetylmuramoyl-L-alanine amidase
LHHYFGLQLRRGTFGTLVAPLALGLALGLAAALGVAADAVAAPGNAANPPGARLESIAVQADRQGALLTLSLSAPVAQHVFRLHDPERLVIDLPATRRRTSLPQLPPDSMVTALRSGVPDGHTLRLVLELRPQQSRMQPQVQPQTRGHGYQLRIALAGAAGGERHSPRSESTATAAATPPTAPSAPAADAALAMPSTTLPSTTRAVHAAHAPHGEHNIVIAVDAGHGGDDPGATGLYGTHEKVVTLAIARALAARINREPGMRAVLTRDGDYFVQLNDRMKRAHAANADMFVSIHADAVLDRGVSGASVYILSERGASSEAAKTLAEHENAADLKGGISLSQQRPDVRSVVLDLAQNVNIGQSVEAADRVLDALDHVGAVRKREVQQAAFVVLKSPDIPSLLVETAYISNTAEERKLRAPADQQRLAEAIFSGIDSYFRKFPPDGSQYARNHDAADGNAPELARSGL